MPIKLRLLFLFGFFQVILSTTLQDYDVCQDVAYSNLCVRLGSKHYLIDIASKLNWFEAERFCRRQNGFLTTIESANELRLISDYLTSKNVNLSDQWFSISGNDLGSEGTFYSIATGMLLPFTDWTAGQPDNAGGNENCVHLWNRGNRVGMNDVNCDRKIHFICELLIDKPIFDIRTDWTNNEKKLKSTSY